MKRSGSKSGLFIVELIIALLLFAYCAAICLQLFVFADNTTKDSAALSKSVFLATSVAESYKASSGSLTEVTEMMGFPAIALSTGNPGGAISVHYDADFNPVSEDSRVYTLRVSPVLNADGSVANFIDIDISYFGPRGDKSVFAMMAGGV